MAEIHVLFVNDEHEGEATVIAAFSTIEEANKAKVDYEEFQSTYEECGEIFDDCHEEIARLNDKSSKKFPFPIEPKKVKGTPTNTLSKKYAQLVKEGRIDQAVAVKAQITAIDAENALLNSNRTKALKEYEELMREAKGNRSKYVEEHISPFAKFVQNLWTDVDVRLGEVKIETVQLDSTSLVPNLKNAIEMANSLRK